MVADEALGTIPPSPERLYVKKVLQCRLVIDPTQAKSIAEWLLGHISEYEKKFGKIVTPREIAEKGKKTATVYNNLLIPSFFGVGRIATCRYFYLDLIVP